MKNIKFLKEVDFSESEVNHIYQFINYDLFDYKEFNQFKPPLRKLSVLIDSSNVSDSTFNNSNYFHTSKISGRTKFEERSFSQKISLSRKSFLQTSIKLKCNETTDSEDKRVNKKNSVVCNSCSVLRKDFAKLKNKYEELVKENSQLKNSITISTNRSQTLRSSRSVSNLNKKISKK